MANIIENVEIRVDASQANREVRNFERRMTGGMDRAGKSAVIFNKLLDIGLQTFSKFGQRLQEGIKMALEYEKTNIALAKVAGSYSKVLNQQSAQLEKLTNVSDEVIRQQQVVAMNMGVSAGEATKFSKAAIALSNATGVDVKTAFDQLTRSLGGMVVRLGYTVPEVKNLTKEQLKAGKAADLILGKYEDFLGLETKGFSGTLKTLSTAWDNLAESMGKAVTQSTLFQDITKKISNKVQFMADIIETGGLSAFAKFWITGAVPKEVIDKLAALPTGAIPKGSEDPQTMTLDPIVIKNPKRKRRGTEFDFDKEFPELVRSKKEKWADEDEKWQDLVNEKKLEQHKTHLDKMLKAEEEANTLRMAENQMMFSKIASMASTFNNHLLNLAMDAAEGEEIAWQARLKAMLKGLGMQLLAQGQNDIMKGISRGLGSYGFDSTAYGLITLGGIESAAGTTMLAGSIPLAGDAAKGAMGGGGGGSSAGALGSGGGGLGAGGSSGGYNAPGGQQTTINVYGALTNEETIMLLDKAHRRKNQAGL